MNLYKFIIDYLIGWRIIDVKTHGTDCGHIDMQSGETSIRIFFNLHGNTRWTSHDVTIDHIESCT